MSLLDLSTGAGLPESTTWRLLATLIDEGLVERATDGSGRYLMGLETFRLGSVVLNRLGIGQNVLVNLEELAAETGETVNLGVLHGFHVLYLQKVESQHTLRASLTVGSATVPAHCSANGKMLLAHLNPASLDALLDAHPLEKLGPNTITDRGALLAELERIRERGYSVDDKEFGPDIRAVAAPIRDHTSAVIAAVAVAAPSSRLSLEGAHALAPTVTATADRISRKLGHTA
jgi:IclR family acetate operon transcriptional repressor